MPFYRRLLSRLRIRPSRVTSIEAFQTLVPLIEKRDVFASGRLADLLVDQSLDDVSTLISSSGATAESFSLGLINRQGTRAMVRSTDALLDEWFGITRRKTFVINTCAMGVKIPTSLPCIDLSVRSDKVFNLVEALAPYFDQFVITSDVFFLKQLVEDGLATGRRWADWPVQFVMGGDWFPESYRGYVAALLQVDLDARRPSTYILGSMGAAELGFNVCWETHETVRVRRLAASDERLCRTLFGAVDTVPVIGHYDPRRWYVELAPIRTLNASGGRLVFTNVDLQAAMPLIRYQTSDCGYLVPRERLSTILSDFGYRSYVPRATLPLMAVAGRSTSSVTAAGQSVRMEFLRSLLYSDHAVASQTTGQFHVTECGGRLQVCVQLRADADGGESARERFSTLINKHVAADVYVVPYFEFRHGMGVDYERKFSHLSRGQ